jgi:hypothetical protein
MLSREVTHEPRVSIVKISPFNLPDPSRRYVVIKAYFDGSGQHRAQQRGATSATAGTGQSDAKALTLGGFSGSEEAWADFLRRWHHVLQENEISHWHTTDAMRCAGYYSKVPGWTAIRAVAVFDSLLRVITACGDYRLSADQRLRTFVSTVYLDDYARIHAEVPDLRPPHAICVNACVGPVVKEEVPPSSILLYFDRNERFKRQMHRVWEQGITRPKTSQHWWAVKVATICELDSRQFMELQAADLVAWLVSRYHTLRLSEGDSSSVSLYFRRIRRKLHRLVTATNATYEVFNYDRIRADYPAGYEIHRQLVHLRVFGTKKQRLRSSIRPEQQIGP